MASSVTPVRIKEALVKSLQGRIHNTYNGWEKDTLQSLVDDLTRLGLESDYNYTGLWKTISEGIKPLTPKQKVLARIEALEKTKEESHTLDEQDTIRAEIRGLETALELMGQ